MRTDTVSLLSQMSVFASRIRIQGNVTSPRVVGHIEQGHLTPPPPPREMESISFHSDTFTSIFTIPLRVVGVVSLGEMKK